MRRLLVALALLVVLAARAEADFLTISRSATIREEPTTASAILGRVEKGDVLILAADEMTNRWYRVRIPNSSRLGWVFQTMGRRHEGLPDEIETGPAPGDTLTICSFNIKFVGSYDEKRNAALAGLLEDYDLVMVQEFVAPPVAGTYPDGTSYTADPEAAAFVAAMEAVGFSFVMSPEDTGPREPIHKASSATEWFVTFYKDTVVEVTTDLPNEFLASDRSAHPTYRRVPYAASFRTLDDGFDFTLINVHLWPGDSKTAEREAELDAVADWVDDDDSGETDFMIVGDMNIKSAAGLAVVLPDGWESLNDECVATNTASTGKPYDHVMYQPEELTELDTDFDLEVVDLIQAMRSDWPGPGAYPGDPYDRFDFPKFYSDHHPVVFRLVIPDEDDDG